MSRAARDLLDIAALIGNRIELKHLNQVAADAPTLLDDLLGSGLIVGDGGLLKFRHEIARLAMAGEIPTHRREVIHARILKALQSLGCEDDAAMAFHAEAVGDASAVLHFAPRAAQRAAELASHREAAAQFERALRFASSADRTLVAALLDSLADELTLIDRWQDDAAIEFTHRAEVAAVNADLPEVLSHALSTQASVLAAIGGDWATPLNRALEIAKDSRAQEQVGRAFTSLYAGYRGTGQFTKAQGYYVEGMAYCDEHDLTTYSRCLKGQRSGELEKLGQWDAATSLCLQLLSQVGGAPINRLFPLMNLAKIRARRGEDGAWECLDEMLTGAIGSGERAWMVIARLARTEAHWLSGDHHAARSEVEAANYAAGGCDDWERGEIAVWLKRTGSAALPQPAIELAKPYRLQLAGEWGAAAQVWSEMGCQYDAAMALLDAVHDEPLRQALAIFDGLGAVAAARITRVRMRELGLRSIPTGAHTQTRAHPLGLTRREQEVLGLLCGGHSNAEIAGRLFIATKTVDHHVSAILSKLGAPTRTAAAVEAARLGLVTTNSD